MERLAFSGYQSGAWKMHGEGGGNWRSDDKRDDENLIGGGCDGWELKRTSECACSHIFRTPTFLPPEQRKSIFLILYNLSTVG